MRTATKEFKWDMAHRLPDHEWKCFNVHWHTYKALITVEWEELQVEWPETWMLRDFSNFKEIQKYIDEWVDYIWISPANDLRPAERLSWLKVCFFKYLIPSWKKIRTHWFGITTYSVIKDIPFFSCDSTSWLSGGRFNSFFRFANWKRSSSNAAAIRKQLWLDPAKMTTIQKREYNLREISKMINYVNALQKAIGLVFYE